MFDLPVSPRSGAAIKVVIIGWHLLIQSTDHSNGLIRYSCVLLAAAEYLNM